MNSESITVYSTAWCGDCRRVKRILDERQVPYKWIDIHADPEAAEAVQQLNHGMRSVPTIFFPNGSVLVEPSNHELVAGLEGVSSSAKEAIITTRKTDVPSRWQGKSITAGLIGSVLASFCCLPPALAVAFGLGLSTTATLSRLLPYQRLFQAAGLLFAGLATWWVLSRSAGTFSLSERKRRRERVQLYVFGTFVVGFVVLNLLVIPLLERHL